MVKVLGHRGERHNPDVYENTAQAIENAFETADGAETDGVRSKDKTVFLAHDSTQVFIKRIVSRSRYVLSEHLEAASAVILGKSHIEDLTDKEIDGLKLKKKDGKLSRLSEVFRRASAYPGTTINIEVKGEDAIGPIVDEIKKAVAAGQVSEEQIVLSSFNHPAIVKARELAPQIKRGLIFSNSGRYDSRMFPWSGNKESRYVTFNEKALKAKLTHDADPSFFVLRSTEVTPENISLLRQHFADAKVMFWTSNEKPPEQNADILKVLTDKRTGPAIEAVITDYPGLMKQLLKTKGLTA